MKMCLRHWIGDLVHAPMYRLYSTPQGDVNFIIRECHYKKATFKYQVTATLSAISVSPTERRQILDALEANKLKFLYEGLLMKPMYDWMVEQSVKLYTITSIPYRTEYFWDPNIVLYSETVHKHKQLRK